MMVNVYSGADYIRDRYTAKRHSVDGFYWDNIHEHVASKRKR